METRARANGHGPIDAAELRWLPRDLDDAGRVFDMLVDQGVTEAVASGCAHFLVRVATGRDRRVSHGTLARYRHLLRDLEAAGYVPPGGKVTASRRATGLLLRGAA